MYTLRALTGWWMYELKENSRRRPHKSRPRQVCEITRNFGESGEKPHETCLLRMGVD